MAVLNKAAKLLTPREELASIFEVNSSYLLKIGVKGLLVDVDNTLIRPSSSSLSLKCLEWIEDLKAHGLKVCLISNDFDAKKVTVLSEYLKVPAMHSTMRPFPFALEKAIKEILQVKPKETAIIGDTILTDILPGNLLELHTILVDPISEEDDSITQKVAKFADNTLVKVITRKST
jgi:putative phosphatase